jgi:uncharacterized protein
MGRILTHGHVCKPDKLALMQPTPPAKINKPSVLAPITAEFQPQRLDVAGFARAGGHLLGALPLAQFPRLLAEAHNAALASAVHIEWQADGQARERSGLPDELWLQLEGRAQLGVTCQRCLEEVVLPLKVNQAYRFVPGERAAQEEDDASEEDVLALTEHLDVYELLEDELLMALPFSPRHAVCPRSLPGQAATLVTEAALGKQPHPFAALQVLKTKL